MKTGLESLDTGAPKITYSGNEGPKAPQQMAMADPFLIEEYQKYVFEMEEQGLQPMSFEEFEAQVRAGMADGGIAMQGGVKNYLGEQETVSGIPVKWQSGPDKPDTELAYITKAEKDLLLKEDIHGSLQDGPNTGPGGIMSLDSQGDFTRDRSPKGRQDAGGNERSRQAQAQHEQHMREILTGQKNIGQTTAYRGPTGDDLVPTGTGDYVSKTESTKPDSSLLDYMPGIGMLRRIASVFGPIDNKEFFVQKVLKSKNPQGYTEDDFEDYMAARMAGTIDAYGNIIGGGDNSPGITSQYPYPYPMSTAMAPAVAPETAVATATGNPFLQGSNLPFSTYGTAAHGTQFGVDPRMFAADGGRIGYFAGDIVENKNVDQVREAILKGIRNGIFTFNDLTQYDETGVPPREEDNISSRYNRAINLIKPFEGKEIREPFYPDRFKGEEIREPFYPDRFENLKPELMAQGGRIGYAGGGITDLRQGYFLGKLVKKIGRGIKKVAKSPLGKAALLAGGAGLFGAGPAAGLFSSGKGLAFKNFLANKILGTMKYGYPTEAGVRTGGLLNYLKTGKGAMTGIAALSSLPLLFGSSEEEDEKDYYADATNIFDTVGSPDKLRQMALAGTLPQNEYPFQSYYAADGGRVGLMDGGDLRAAALTEMYNDDEEDKKLALGGSAGLPPITAGIEGQNSQSFSDDETPAPTQQDQMPMPNPMMAGRMNPMMAGRMNPMMARGMSMPRTMANEGGIMMASAPDPMDERNSMMENLAMEYFGKPLRLLNEQEIIEIEEMMDNMDPYGSKPMAPQDIQIF